MPLVTECEAALYDDDSVEAVNEAPRSADARIEKFRTEGSAAFEQGQYGMAVLHYTRALHHRSMMHPIDESRTLSNRSAAFLKLELGNEALADATASSMKDENWAKPLVRAGQAALVLQDFKAAYANFAKARRIENINPAACDGVNDCLQKIVKWDYPQAVKRWNKFTIDRRRPRDKVRIWALSDIHFDQHGAPEWCKALSSSFFRDDVLLVAGNMAGNMVKLKFGLTVLKSKFRRVFFIPGNHDLWVRRWTMNDLMKGEKVQDELKLFGDSVAKLLEVLQACDELGVETAPAEVAAGVFVVPLLSWYSRDFVDRDMKKEHASQTDAEVKITIDQWINWPFGCGADDAWKFFMKTNEASLSATMMAKANYEQFSNDKAVVLTMTHFLTRPELKFDWSVPGIWDHIGCGGLDEQIRTVGSSVHVYGHSCKGGPVTEIEGIAYVHRYLGKSDDIRPELLPWCVYNRGQVNPKKQPAPDKR